ncbi:hypothetical protein GW17_00048397 [Ensete ventricosum]|nr:hypothetical protein GW17_00048397 [Ensete ventricosum]
MNKIRKTRTYMSITLSILFIFFSVTARNSSVRIISKVDRYAGMDWTGLSFQEIMDDAENTKNTGNRLFKEGKFELAKAKYEKMISIDKSSESDATAALLKLKQKEQVFDWGYMFGGDDEDDKIPDNAEHEIEDSRSEKDISKTNLDGGVTDSEHEPERIGFLGRLWPSGTRILAALGLNRCSIL